MEILAPTVVIAFISAVFLPEVLYSTGKCRQSGSSDLSTLLQTLCSYQKLPSRLLKLQPDLECLGPDGDGTDKASNCLSQQKWGADLKAELTATCCPFQSLELKFKSFAWLDSALHKLKRRLQVSHRCHGYPLKPQIASDREGSIILMCHLKALHPHTKTCVSRYSNYMSVPVWTYQSRTRQQTAVLRDAMIWEDVGLLNQTQSLNRHFDICPFICVSLRVQILLTLPRCHAVRPYKGFWEGDSYCYLKHMCSEYCDKFKCLLVKPWWKKNLLALKSKACSCLNSSSGLLAATVSHTLRIFFLVCLFVYFYL